MILLPVNSLHFTFHRLIIWPRPPVFIWFLGCFHRYPSHAIRFGSLSIPLRVSDRRERGPKGPEGERNGTEPYVRWTGNGCGKWEYDERSESPTGGHSLVTSAPSIVSLRPSVISALRPSSFACRVIRPEGARRARNEARRVPTSRGTAGEPDKERDGSQTDHGSEGDMIAVNLSFSFRTPSISWLKKKRWEQRDAYGRRLMVDGRWQAGKVTIDLNVGRSLASLLSRHILAPYARPFLTPYPPEAGARGPSATRRGDERMEEARSVRARFTRSHGSLHASGSTLLSSVFHLQH